MKKFKGFTLTELMVALAVIGILTAVVTPTIMRIKPNKNKMMTKKAYYTAENIISSLINDEHCYPDDSANNPSTTTLGFDDIGACTQDGATYTGNTKFAGLFADKLNLKGSACTSAGTNYQKCTTTDGLIWYLPITDFNTTNANNIGTTTIFVDVNGDDGPNCRQTAKDYAGTACTGSEDEFDQFGIKISENGKMQIDATKSGTGCTTADEGDCMASKYIEIDTKISNGD